ncbi:hydroxymethylglutaryl-CoA reductase [Botryobacter ruber]|uniref:hydroxymethylglutaryl-CoA reductase n=1 Tax=Botryobacter ruber TaxID=2171629 RepID=UPI000E0C1391|nr:hydroxymethylglutaryl-CoA reductase [Botryobacter ruber]
MASSSAKSDKALQILSTFGDIAVLAESIRNKAVQNIKSDRLPIELGVSEESVAKRKEFLAKETEKELPYLTGQQPFSDLKQLEGNIENYIGMSLVPTGVIGPVRVLGSAAQGDFFVPLATSEGALVASYHRGAKACYLAGGVTSICLVEGVQRSPVFKFSSIAELGLFIAWALPQMEEFKAITERCSRYAKLTDMKANIEGNHLILTFEFHTGDAAGQNMVTLCTDQICHYIIENSPIKPEFYFIESNYSGDKKATVLSFTNVRGKKVTTEIVLPEHIVNSVLKTTPEAMAEYWRSSTVGVIQSGAIGAQGHYANGLTALFIATGQDAACVAEAATGITRMELNKDGSLYASVTLPNLIVGTVGGGTSLPTQRECLELMECYGPGKARKFAEICGAVVLAGELSIAAALSAGHFSAAHKNLGRKKQEVA